MLEVVNLSVVEIVSRPKVDPSVHFHDPLACVSLGWKCGHHERYRNIAEICGDQCLLKNLILL